MEMVILVDDADRPNGVEEKLEAHRAPGSLHRALSVLLFDLDGRVLVQRRAMAKHHFRGLWSNTCCSHPRPGEDVGSAGRRRLLEEMGIAAELAVVGNYTYRAVDPDSSLVEHEIVHVLVGRYEGDPTPDPDEVADWEWVDIDWIRADVVARPDRYTPWLPLALDVARPSPG